MAESPSIATAITVMSTIRLSVITSAKPLFRTGLRMIEFMEIGRTKRYRNNRTGEAGGLGINPNGAVQ
jgi:hypothetical protein